MGEHSMLPIQAILNRSPPRTYPGSPNSQLSASELSSPASESNDTFPPTMEEHRASKPKKIRDSSDLSYSRPQGPINYPPFETLDRDAHDLMRPFRVYPFGEIAQYCAQIPYSSDKKDVFEKTGRENINVFVYRFTDPSDNQTFDVMWDYLGGFVRISPFFKSLKHKKTGPAKMLDANKGLREISFHMTGGNRVAQGYWVPYSCARAVCAKFCYPIAGALIPIFGPEFPYDCIRLGSNQYGRMDINCEIIKEAKFKVMAYRHASSNHISQPRSITSHPQPLPDPYSIAMKQRLGHRPDLRTRIPSPCSWPPPHDLRIVASQAVEHSRWATTPEREPSTAASEGSSTRTPINDPRYEHGDQTVVDPILSSVPYHAVEEGGSSAWKEPPARTASPVQQCANEDLKRRLAEAITPFKRRRLDEEPEIFREPKTLSNEDCKPACSKGLVEVRQAADAPPQTVYIPVRADANSIYPDITPPTPPYSVKEREAAFSLLSMGKDLDEDDCNTSRSHQHRRARSV